MSSHPPPVPSHGALRALRRLAYGASTVIGAVGSVLAAATVNYDAQRRFRLAEKLVETKQTIRSVSNSNGAAYVARMFEAAERGEAFGVEVTRAQKKHKKRRYSAIANAKAKTEELPAEDGLAAEFIPAGKDSPCKASGRHRITFRRGFPVGFGERTMMCPDLGSMASFETRTSWKPPPASHRQGNGPQDKDETTENAPGRHRITWRQGLPVGFGERTMMCPDLGSMASFETTTSWEPEPVFQPQISKNLPSKDEPMGSFGRARDTAQAGPEFSSDVQAVETITRRRTPSPLPERLHVLPGTDAASTESGHTAGRTLSAAERIMAATRQQHKVHNHAVFGRPGRSKIGAWGDLNKNVDLWLKGDAKPILSLETEQDPITSHDQPVDLAEVQNRADYVVQDPKHEDAALPKAQINSHCLDINEVLDHRAEIQKHTDGLLPQADVASIYSFPRSQEEHTRSQITFDQPSKPWTSFIPANRESEQALDPVDASGIKSPSAADQIALLEHSETMMDSVTEVRVPPADAQGDRNLYNKQTKRQTIIQEVNDLSSESPQDIKTSSSLLAAKRLPSIDSEEIFQACVLQAQEEGPAAWNKYICIIIEQKGRPAGKEIWLKAMTHYSGSDAAQDWDIGYHLYESFAKRWPAYVNSRPVRQLTRHYLKSPPLSNLDVQRNANLLFPVPRPPAWKEAEFAKKDVFYNTQWQSRDVFANARRHLDEAWDEGTTPVEAISELRKVIRAAKVLSIDLAENLFVDTIRRLCSVGEVDQAQVLFDEMRFYHQIQPSFFTRSFLVYGYAQINDWDRVAREIEIMHNEDLSRQEPFGYAIMFNAVLQDYASKRPISQTHDFLLNALGYWGLVPTSAISATAIQTYLTHRRFDLVREWVETVRILFPQVDTETSAFAWKIGDVWEQIDASCEEIEETYRAMSYRKGANKPSDQLKGLAREALARDLAKKLHAKDTAAKGTKEDNKAGVDSPLSLHDYFKLAHSTAAFADSSESHGTESEEAREFLSQLRSVSRLNEIFQSGNNAKSSSLSKLPRTTASKRVQEINLSDRAHLQSHLPQELMREFLPNIQEVQRMLGDYYLLREADGLATNHGVVKYVCRKLTKQNRQVDALKVLRTTYDSPYVQNPSGTMFDLSVFEMWLKTAYEIKSMKTSLSVLWAVLDADNVKLTSKFLLLAQLASWRVQENRFANTSSRHPQIAEEFDWLLKRLKWRLREQDGKGNGLLTVGLRLRRKTYSELSPPS